MNNYKARKIEKGEWFYRGYIIVLKMNKAGNFGGRYTYWQIEGEGTAPSLLRITRRRFQQLGEARQYI